ncbi:MAG: single-stranded DNA-binding protein [Lentisphaerae bacterium]|nr:single-stranded DNA-binding protein [Lentisphaerota bacterium]
MASLNKVFLAGNLTRDPEVRYTPSGTAVSDLGMAVNRKFRSANGEDREETCFVTVVVWARQAETCGQYLRKGSPILVEGRLQYDEWEREGQKQSRLRVVAERVQFLGGRRSDEPPERREAAGPPPARRAAPAREPAEEAPAIGDTEPPPPQDEDDLPF